MKKKQVELAVEHIISNINIKLSKTCAKCPYRLYAKSDETVTLGTGNISSNFIFVLPTYDTRTKLGYSNLLTVLADGYREVIGKDLFTEIYVTRLVKCYTNSEHDLYSQAIGPCSGFLIYELNKLPARNILFFGSAYDDYNNNSDTVGMSIPNKNIFHINSPGVLFYDNEKFKKKFYQHLLYIINNNN